MTQSQTEFAEALLAPEAPVPGGLQDAAGRPAGRRFAVYRNNVAASLTEALHEGFPAVASLLGKENMDGLAGIYLRQHPPASPLMMHFGGEFPDFLAGMRQLSHLGYLPDVARLELALRRSYHAADAAPLPAERLAGLSPDALMAARLQLAPAVELLRSDWPLFDIWCYATQEGAPKPQASAQDVLITRPDFDPVAQPLPPGSAQWIAALRVGHSIGEAFETTLEIAPDFDLSAPLALLLEGGGLTDLMT
ncbi:DNA-binding domain-containing protein [Phaeobacter sp. QD34_3]|uniref:HvfC/BufC N-terminal domain-containing protein n=1 Tax=unclassified Phaeobacter TaxID=2621772 RepID=UPI00237FC8ED|nr:MULTISPECIES: DNA-binding domain-containing protein [unclassified Phaeobacter]MDE4131988.1 DNA-binding domain-containing protein [Phaeobacter sp. QD34_3]MDE4135626.1 DNA-binding domain-containing protein [Phaeobacter sp. QD34_24]